MADYVLLGLTKRRAELAGEVDALKARQSAIATDLGHLDAVIRLFDPDYDLASIRAKRPRGPDAAQRGERSRVLLGVLREATGPLTTTEVVRRSLAKQGVNPDDKKLVRSMMKRVGLALARQERQGVLRSTRREGELLVWKIAR